MDTPTSNQSAFECVNRPTDPYPVYYSEASTLDNDPNYSIKFSRDTATVVNKTKGKTLVFTTKRDAEDEVIEWVYEHFNDQGKQDLKIVIVND